MGCGEPLAAQCQWSHCYVHKDQRPSAWLQHGGPSTRAGANLKDDLIRRNPSEQDMLHKGLLPLRGGVPLLAAAGPIPPRPAIAVGHRRVVSPAPVSGA